jgi:hypothetical protein
VGGGVEGERIEMSSSSSMIRTYPLDDSDTNMNDKDVADSSSNSNSNSNISSSSEEDEEKQKKEKEQQSQSQDFDQEQGWQRQRLYRQRQQQQQQQKQHQQQRLTQQQRNQSFQQQRQHHQRRERSDSSFSATSAFNIDIDSLPLEIQLALEDTVLGWTHLTSEVIGHVLLPWLVYYTVQHASKSVLESTILVNTTNNSDNEEDDHQNIGAVEAILVSPTTHCLLGAVAAIAAFRWIRHHRKVWFRHAYGSKAYKRCDEGRRRREAVINADRRTSSLMSFANNASSSSQIQMTTTTMQTQAQSDSSNTTEQQNQNQTQQNSKRCSTPSTSSTTITGKLALGTSKIITNYKRKKHKKRLQKASDRFDRHHTSISPKSKTGRVSVSQTQTKQKQRSSTTVTTK